MLENLKTVKARSEVDLRQLFLEINRDHFEGLLAPPRLLWNSRLRTTSGRFVSTRYFNWRNPPLIEVATFLLRREDARSQVWDTLGHEMIHYWLWVRGRPHGHTLEFKEKMKEIGVSRYSEVHEERPHKYRYQCPGCFREYLTRRIMRNLACRKCCMTYTNGKFSSLFELQLVEQYY